MPDSHGTKTPPAFLFALGRASMPPTVEVSGAVWRFAQLYKHDFFAATALYENAVPAAEPRHAVLKIQRTYHLFGLPMRWLGARVARHEIRVYQALQGVRGVPRFLGSVGNTGFLHEYIPGEDLRENMSLPAPFFADLRRLIEDVHARHIAYVDTNKRENILLGADGRPWLIDFQISYFAAKGARSNALTRSMLRRLQRADWYHFYKHKTRLAPALCTPADFAAAERRGALHTLHRWIAQPLIRLRRRFLARYRLEKTT